DQNYRAAVSEQLDIHVDLVSRRSAPLPADLLANLQAIVQAHATLPTPDKLGRCVTTERR
ncbi:MAG TPA: hypothetical protein VLC91_11455, partial [Spongiibacteraceae bacterium]|nr:hypothetical protein [Spongiibacteraceae bacterium]